MTFMLSRVLLYIIIFISFFIYGNSAGVEMIEIRYPKGVGCCANASKFSSDLSNLLRSSNFAKTSDIA